MRQFPGSPNLSFSHTKYNIRSFISNCKRCAITSITQKKNIKNKNCENKKKSSSLRAEFDLMQEKLKKQQQQKDEIKN